jgi:hypothetical protein
MVGGELQPYPCGDGIVEVLSVLSRREEGGEARKDTCRNAGGSPDLHSRGCGPAPMVARTCVAESDILVY